MGRGPHDHPEAIIYMSCATPRKAKGAAGWPGSRSARLASGRPLARRDHGPDGPDGPEGVEDLSLRVHAPSRASECGSPLFAAGASFERRDHRGRWSRRGGRNLERFGGCRLPEARLGATPGSFGFGSPAPPTQPAVVFAPRDPGPSYLAPGGGAVASSWLASRFQIGARRRSLSRSGAGAERSAANAITGIIVGVASACFRFAFDQQAPL